MNEKKNGILFVLSGPSGCGKDTVLHKYLEQYDEAFLSVSVTTRKPREGEKNGKDYYFISTDEMEKLIQTGGVLEYAEYCGNYYGTPRDKVEEMLKSGRHVILEIETVGALKVKKSMEHAVLIFVAPPSLEELRHRLIGRKTDSMDVIEKRLKKAEEEMKLISEYQYCIVNDEIKKAVGRLHCIIEAESCKVRP